MGIERAVLKANGFSRFNQMQQDVLKKNWGEKNLVVSAPTASGKTVVAELAALHSILSRKRKAIYTCPLRALASEHFNDLKKKYRSLGIRMALSTGDLDSSSKYLQGYDFIFTTYEKLDSLIRHRAGWLQSVGLLIVDEVHELDSSRGATLEVTICKLRQTAPKMQLLALSATIPNACEIAEWLNADLVESSFRPIPLHEGVCFNEEIKYAKKKKPDTIKGEGIEAIVKDTISKKQKQALVFCSTRRNAEATAGRISSLTQQILSLKEKRSLQKEAEKILNTLETPTAQCKRLAELVEKGTAFHHAGLVHKQRSTIEEAFRANTLKVISATPTLAAGINVPAHTVVIPSLYRFEAWGMSRIPIREYKQMAGRASRPKFDKEGRSVLIAKSDLDADELMENYVKGQIETVSSQLGIEPVLRMHLLSLIASHFVFDLHSLEQFFSKTFYAMQYGNLAELFAKMQEILEQLEEWGFIQSDENKIMATALGNRVSELYLDPFTAHEIVEAMKLKQKFSDLTYLYLFAQSTEFMPWLSVSKKKEQGLWVQLQEKAGSLPINVEKEMYFDSNLLRKFQSALLLQQWVGELSEQQVMEQFNTQPGILHSKLRICDWLAYSALEIAKLLQFEQHFSPLSRIRKRLKYGVKEQLVALTEVKSIGRVRARRLWNANIRTIQQLKKTDERDLARVLGEKIAAAVKKALKS